MALKRLPTPFFRVDDRLIHGQIIEGWIRVLATTAIVVASDQIAQDPFQKSIMEMAVPEDIKLYIIPVEETAGLINELTSKGENPLTLFSSLSDAERAVDAGLRPDTLNIGAVRYSAGKRKITSAIFLNSGEEEILLKLIRKGIKVKVQPTPKELCRDMGDLLKK